MSLRMLPGVMGLTLCLWFNFSPLEVRAAQYTAYSLKVAQQRIEQAGESWRRKEAEAVNLAGINKVEGFVFDNATGDLILVGQREQGRAALTLDNLVVALRARFRYNEWPLVSIDPTPDTEKTQMQHVRFEGGIQDTAFGQVMFDADYRLKEVLPVSLIAYWKLDETEGTIAYDSVGDHDGTLHGDRLWQPSAGKINGALEFDCIDDYVSTPFVLNLAEEKFSVFAWIKGGAPGQVIISQTQGGANWLLADPLEGRLMTSLSAPAGRFPPQPLTSETVITDGNWHRVGFTWDGSTRILYVDDVEVAKDTQSSLAGSEGGLYIRAGKDRDPASFFSGLIDDVKIYDRAVTP